jgi:hypothetical protein
MRKIVELGAVLFSLLLGSCGGDSSPTASTPKKGDLMIDRYTKVLLMPIVALRRHQKPLFVGVIAMMLSSLLLLGCSAQASPTGTEETSLADQVKGTFIGEFQNPSMSSSPHYISDYEIIVTKIDDTSVRVAPASGSASSTFVANLESTVNGSVTSITLKAPADIVENNGSYVVYSGVARLAYAYHLGGSESANLEIFTGLKQ